MRSLATFTRYATCAFVLSCLGCSSQSVPVEVAQRIERQVRLFYNIRPDVKISVSRAQRSEFHNYDTVIITFEAKSKKQDYEFLLSRDAKTLIRMTKLDLSNNPSAAEVNNIDVRGRPARGNKNAKVVVVVWNDFQCPFCSRMHQVVFSQLLEEYGNRVAFMYKDFPLAEVHPWAVHAAVDANCLAAQSSATYWDFADDIHAGQQEINSREGRDAQSSEVDRLALLKGQRHNLDMGKLKSCIRSQDEQAIRTSIMEGQALGVNATPTLFVNGRKVEGARSISDLRSILDSALEEAGVPVPVNSAITAQSVVRQPAK